MVAALFLFLVAVWALTARGYFWPAWTLLGLGERAFVLHWLITRNRRRDRLSRRVETLETTRLGAVEEQDAELRRIERDLHDGAQARLVALGHEPRDGASRSSSPTRRAPSSWSPRLERAWRRR